MRSSRKPDILSRLGPAVAPTSGRARGRGRK